MPHAGSEARAGCLDVVIIGAGVVGCAVARRLALGGATTLVVEKASDILDGASKGNSAILHTGFDAPPDSLEQACLAAAMPSTSRFTRLSGCR
jgi:glycerol-3-phosphate dehydrogenase